MWMDKISKEEFDEEYFIEKINHYMKNNKIILYGAGDRAKFLYDYLADHSIHISTVVISRKYWKTGMKMRGTDITVACLEDFLLSEKRNVVIILGLPKYLVQEKFFAFPNVCDVVDINIGVRKDYIIKRSFLLEHEKEITELYEMLGDDKSRNMLIAHLNGRITGKSVPYEKMPWTDPSYFLKEFMCKEVSPWLESECIIDCGAYIGDTYEEFKEATASSNVKNYKYYCIEPDLENVGYLKKKYRFDDNIVIFNGGAWCEKTTLNFAGGMETGAVSSDGDILIEVDCIDNILSCDEKVTYIKMDIEGSELNALKGAEQHIVRDKPRLGICIYHKQEDLVKIPQYIKSLHPHYQFYVRPHSTMPTELVLYCF